MGGKAFAAGPEPLPTPRMPLDIYHVLLGEFSVKLAKLFERIATPIEAPEKTSFGDVDVIVAEPKTLPFHPDQISKILSAKRTVSSKPLYSFAVPYPNIEGSFVQLDVQLCKSEDFDWEVFHKCHGDLWNLLGSSIRPFGLTANDTGLHLRIPEIETFDRKKALVYLTADPDIVLDFLGLDRGVYWQAFHTTKDMFEFACTTRFFRAEAYARDGLKANDRKRMAQRDLYRRFVDEFLRGGTNTVKGQDQGTGLTREKVLDEALAKFGKQDEFVTRVEVWRKAREELSHRQETREWKKMQAMEDEAYASAWINWLTSRVPIAEHGTGKGHVQSK
ncbi:MAG: hypothetical protein Q9170_006577 [Blastenia crenularia]